MEGETGFKSMNDEERRKARKQEEEELYCLMT